MAGVKRRSKYRKQVEDDALHGFPEPGEGELIVRVNCSRGGNLFEVRAAATPRPARTLPHTTARPCGAAAAWLHGAHAGGGS